MLRDGIASLALAKTWWFLVMLLYKLNASVFARREATRQSKGTLEGDTSPRSGISQGRRPLTIMMPLNESPTLAKPYSIFLTFITSRIFSGSFIPGADSMPLFTSKCSMPVCSMAD